MEACESYTPVSASRSNEISVRSKPCLVIDNSGASHDECLSAPRLATHRAVLSFQLLRLAVNPRRDDRPQLTRVSPAKSAVGSRLAFTQLASHALSKRQAFNIFRIAPQRTAVRELRSAAQDWSCVWRCCDLKKMQHDWSTSRPQGGCAGD